jgi:hypothetical protein
LGWGPRESEDSDLGRGGYRPYCRQGFGPGRLLALFLELEGYEAKLCERPIDPPADGALRTCLLLDQEVFTTLWGKGGAGVLTRFGLPTVLMVNQRTKRLMDHANAAGVTTVLEKPLLGGVLFEAIRSALDGDAR